MPPDEERAAPPGAPAPAAASSHAPSDGPSDASGAVLGADGGRGTTALDDEGVRPNAPPVALATTSAQPSAAVEAPAVSSRGAPSVRERPLGQTGLDVTELAVGTWGLSGDGYGPVAKSEAEGVVRRALELGVRLFETSDAYARGGAEELLGRVLEPYGEAARVATRHGVDRSSEPARKRFDAGYLERAFTASLARLRRPRIDLYLLHNPTIEVLERVEVLRFVKGLREAGRVGAWGVSAGSVEVARAAMASGAEVLELAYNGLFCADLHALAGEIASRRVGVLAHSVLAYGLLAGMWPENKQFQPGDHRRERWQGFEMPARVKQLDALRSLQGGDVYTLRSAALRFVLANHLVSSAVLGPRTVTQLEQLVREAGKGPPYLDEDKLARLPAKLTAMRVET